MYVLEWRIVSALTRGFVWCLFTKLRSNDGNKTRLGAETVRHESTYIILFLTRHKESINDDKNDELYTSYPCLTRSFSVLLMIFVMSVCFQTSFAVRYDGANTGHTNKISWNICIMLLLCKIWYFPMQSTLDKLLWNITQNGTRHIYINTFGSKVTIRIISWHRYIHTL